MDEELLALPLLGKGDRTAVDTRVVLFVGDQRSLHREELVPGIGFVRVDRIAVSVHLPKPRNGHLAPRRVVDSGTEESFGFGAGAVNTQEGPYTVERTVEG